MPISPTLSVSQLFGFGKTEQVVPLSYQDGLISFTCTSKYRVGKSAKVKLILVYGETVQTATVSLTVVSFEPNEDGTYTCSGALEVSASKLPTLVLQMAYAGVEGADRRGSKRLPYTIRILSKELASFRAVSNNINLTGTEIDSDSPVSIDHYMILQFDLESVGFPVLKLQGQCVWTREEIDDSTRRPRYRVGVRFTEQHPETHAAWAKFYRSILAIEGASVMQKTMDGGAITDPRTENLNLDDSVPVPPPPPPPQPAASSSASSSGGWTPPVGNPFASGEMPAIPPADPGSGGASTNSLSFVTPPAAVPAPTQMGGGFNTQAAPPPPLLPNKLSLRPAGAPPGRPPADDQRLGSSPTELGGLPPASPPQTGFGFPPASPQTPPGGFSFPPAASSGGYSAPTPSSSGGFPFSSPPATPGSGGFQLPPPPASQPGGFSPPAHGGFQLPSPAGPPSTSPPSVSGFQLPPTAPPTSQPGGFGFPPQSGPGSWSPPASPGSGFPTSAGLPGGFPGPSPTPSQPQPPQSSGFQLPPPLPPMGVAQPSGFSFPSAQPPAQPEPVAPLGISGANLAYRTRLDSSNQPGARKQVLMTFNLGGQSTSVPINVSLSRVEPAPDGTCVCWATVLEDAQKIQILNQVLGSR